MILARSMTDKAAGKWPIMQISALLRLFFTTPFWELVTYRVQTKFFEFCRHVLCYNRISVTTLNIKNSGFLVWIQDGNEEKREARRKLRATLRLRWTALKTNWCKKMRIYNTALKHARFIRLTLRENVLNSRQWGNILEFLTAAWSYRALQKNPPLYLTKKLPGTARNLKVNEQSKYKSAQILFSFLVIEGKPAKSKSDSCLFEPAI